MSLPKSPSRGKQGQRGATRDDGKGLVKEVADAICEKNRFAVDQGGKLYHWQNGVYHPNGDRVVKKLVKRYVIGTFQDKNWKRALNLDVSEFIAIDAPTLWDRPPIDVLNVRNGLLRLKDRTLKPHDPRHLSPSQLPVVFDPDATCPEIDKFVQEVFPADSIPLAYELAGWLMLAITWIQKAILLYGPGGNGKSVYLNLITKFLGRNNYSSLPLHKLESDRFASSRLIGKLANICSDLPTDHLAGTSVFKAITGGDELTAEYKFRDSFDFTPFARLVFSSNALPRSNDQSPGFFDRWIVLPFDRSFRGEAIEIPRSELDAKLTSDAELSGLLNKALDAIDQVKARKWKLHQSATLDKAHQEFHSITDPLGVWLDQFTADDPDSIVPKNMLRAAYGAECERKGNPPPTDQAFGLQMKRHRQNITTAQRTFSGKVQWCYVGIALRSELENGQQTKQTKQGLLTCYPPTNHLRQEGISERDISRGKSVKSVNPVKANVEKREEKQTFDEIDRANLELNTVSPDAIEGAL